MKKILITGGNGFVGSHLSEKLRENYSPVIFDSVEKEGSRDYFINGDITQSKDLKNVPEDLEGIIHLAAISRVLTGHQNPLDCMNVNVIGTMNILELARRNKNQPWVIISSTNAPLNTIYGLSKSTAESCARLYSENYILKTLSLKFSDAYGLGDNPNKAIPKLIKKALDNEEILITNPEKSFDYIYIDDLISGISKAVDYMQVLQKNDFNCIPLCTGKLTNLKELAETVVRLTNSNSKITLDKGVKEEDYSPDPRPAEKLFSFKSETILKEGIKKILSL